MTTCATSPASDLFATSDTCPASSSDRPPARTSPAPTTAAPKASMGPGPGSTSRPSASSAKSDLIGMRLRTLLSSRLEATTGFTLRWKRSATPAGHPWWVLSTPDFSTFASDLGLLAFMAPTPRANRWGPPDSHGRPHPMLPTQTLTGNNNRKGMSEKSGDGLATVVRKMLPTPLAAKGGGHGGAFGNGSPTLPGAVRTLLATPIMSDGMKSAKSSDATFQKNSRPSREQLDRSGSGGVRALLSITEWLLGFDPGWLASAFPPTATLSSRRSPKPSGE